MRHIKSINELIRNKSSLKYSLNKAILRLNNRLSRKIIKDNIRSEIRNEYYKIEFLHTSEKDHQIWIKWLKNLKSNLFKDDIIMSYKDYKKLEQRFIDNNFEMESTGNILYDYIIYIKNVYTKRIKPNRYIYHYSKQKYRQEILQNGLKVKEHKDSEDWGNEAYLEYPKSIFAVNSEDIWREGDRWQIDTTKCKNIWWEDLNFVKRTDMIMTFSNIPKEAISLQNDI